MNPDTWESVDTVEGSSGVMVSNLPLLFSHGYPTALDVMSLTELESFVSFMVKCSISDDLTVPWSQLPKPPWWPSRLPFRIPSNIPSAKDILKKLVQRCYTFHGCEYMIEFCSSLHDRQPNCGYRFTDNRDGTTSMYHGATGKLLVTFRNENRDYDRAVVPKFSHSQKKLLPLSPKWHNEHCSNKLAGVMVRPPIVDVFLCDKCDDEFSSLKEVQVHERHCNGDTLICPKAPSPELEFPEEDQEPNEQVPFLSYLGLRPAEHTGIEPYCSPRKRNPTPAKKRTSVSNYLRFETVPVSSPFGRCILSRCRYGGKLQVLQNQVLRYEKYTYSKENESVFTRERTSNRWITVWRPRRDEQPWCHLYSFTKQHKKERLITINTGLNKRSRQHLNKLKRVIQLRLNRRSENMKIENYSQRHPTAKSNSEIACVDLTASDELPTVAPPPNSLLHEALTMTPKSNPPLENGTAYSNNSKLCSDASVNQLNFKDSVERLKYLKPYGVTITPVYDLTSNSKQQSYSTFNSEEIFINRQDSSFGESSTNLLNSLLKRDPLSVTLVKPIVENNIEVIDLSSDDEIDSESTTFKTRFSSPSLPNSKNGCSHCSPIKSFPMNGRKANDLAINGFPQRSVQPPTLSPSPTNSTSLIFPTQTNSHLNDENCISTGENVRKSSVVVSQSDTDASNSAKVTLPHQKREVKLLLKDECRELKGKGLDGLKNCSFTSRSRVTRCSFKENGRSVQTRKNKYFLAKMYKYKPNPTYSTTKPVLKNALLSQFLLKKSEKSMPHEVDDPISDRANCINNNTCSTVNNNALLITTSNKTLLIPPNKEDPIKKKRRHFFKKRCRRGLSREVNSLLGDECKEIKKRGFHPTRIFGRVSHAPSPSFYCDKNSPNNNILLYSKKPKKLDDISSDMHCMIENNKRLKRELSLLMNDEWKELKESGHHPSQIRGLLSNNRNLRGSNDSGAVLEKTAALYDDDSEYPLIRSTRYQSKMLAFVEVETPRTAHRKLIQSETGMCVINYDLPTIQ